MPAQILVNILAFYGCFLIACGIVSVIFIGMKAKTALISGGTSGALALFIARLIYMSVSGAEIAGLVLPFVLFFVFSWRSTKTLFRLFDMIRSGHEELKGKGIAFLIISLMAVVSVMVLIFQIAML